MARKIFNRLKLYLYRRLAVGHGVVLGKGVHIGPGSILSAPRQLIIGDDVYIGKFCTIQCDGSIGKWTMIANNVGIVGRRDHNYRQMGIPIRKASHVEDPDRILGAADIIQIQEDVWIGFGAVLLSGIVVGRGAIIAAGAVVVSSVAPYTIVGGNPAAVIGRRFEKDADILTHETALYNS